MASYAGYVRRATTVQYLQGKVLNHVSVSPRGRVTEPPTRLLPQVFLERASISRVPRRATQLLRSDGAELKYLYLPALRAWLLTARDLPRPLTVCLSPILVILCNIYYFPVQGAASTMQLSSGRHLILLSPASYEMYRRLNPDKLLESARKKHQHYEPSVVYNPELYSSAPYW